MDNFLPLVPSTKHTVGKVNTQIHTSQGTHSGRGGSREQRQNAPTGHDEVVHHLGDEVYTVVDKHHVLTVVHKVQNSLCRVAEGQKTKKKHTLLCSQVTKKSISR